MASHSRGRVGRLDEAEDGATLMVEPIGPEFCSESILNFDVFAVPRRHILGRHTSRHVVAVHESRHGAFHSLNLAQPAGRIF
jgi:hypothetical protein